MGTVNPGAENMMTIGDWCITKDPSFSGAGIYADHIANCRGTGPPSECGDVCWAYDDEEAVCYYCKGAVPPEIQALVLLQTKV